MALHAINQWAHSGWGAAITLAFFVTGHLVLGALLMGVFAVTKETWDVLHDHQALGEAAVDLGFYWLGIIGAIMFTIVVT